MTGQPELKLYNTLTRKKEPFTPIDPDNVRMYVCGPTVYDFAHIGNARPVIVFDVLYRLLRHVYGADHVTYVRNITDVDDKINARALRDHGEDLAAGKMSLNEAIRAVTEKTASRFQADADALGCLRPDHQPRATEHIEGMITMIQTLINKGNAYLASGSEGREVLFAVNSMEGYGRLSNRKLDDQQAGARVAVEGHKRNPGDFVLWKESSDNEPGWNGNFTADGVAVPIHGRPGWHIECSVMAKHHLGEIFDIHGGGLDLIFPHHENEIAQSCCAHDNDRMANIWMHNGFLQVEGQKMSKSLGNFMTMQDLMETDKFGGRKWPGEVLRLAMLMTHYREPIDFSVKRLEEAEGLYLAAMRLIDEHQLARQDIDFLSGFLSGTLMHKQNNYLGLLATVLSDDLATPTAITMVQGMITDINSGASNARELAYDLTGVLAWLGVINAETLRRRMDVSDETKAKIANRLALLNAKDFASADAIRDELLEQGIQLKDGKDAETGERITTWEVKR